MRLQNKKQKKEQRPAGAPKKRIPAGRILYAVCEKRLLPDIFAEVLCHAVHEFHVLA